MVWKQNLLRYLLPRSTLRIDLYLHKKYVVPLQIIPIGSARPRRLDMAQRNADHEDRAAESEKEAILEEGRGPGGSEGDAGRAADL